jgi:hypothetical protein
VLDDRCHSFLRSTVLPGPSSCPTPCSGNTLLSQGISKAMHDSEAAATGTVPTESEGSSLAWSGGKGSDAAVSLSTAQHVLQFLLGDCRHPVVIKHTSTVQLLAGSAAAVRCCMVWWKLGLAGVAWCVASWMCRFQADWCRCDCCM